MNHRVFINKTVYLFYSIISLILMILCSAATIYGIITSSLYEFENIIFIILGSLLFVLSACALLYFLGITYVVRCDDNAISFRKLLCRKRAVYDWNRILCIYELFTKIGTLQQRDIIITTSTIKNVRKKKDRNKYVEYSLNDSPHVRYKLMQFYPKEILEFNPFINPGNCE